MNILQAKEQVKNTLEAYFSTDEQGYALLDPAKQRPVFLVGAPGIGKTAVMAQVADELGVGLVSYSMTHHTRQSALGLPFISHESFDGFSYEASRYTMSEIIAAVYDYMRSTGKRRGILFLDEINCVSETLYPSMLQFLQFKTFGSHKVPEGWIVACAGNPPDYNRSVHEFDIVTLDRVKKITVEPDYEAWKSYALAKGVHPAVLTFLDIKKDRFYSVESTLDGVSFVTARGWDDLSDIVRVLEQLGKPVDYDLVVQYVQNEKIAREFAAYYELFSKYRDDYRIDEVLAGCVGADVLERARAAEFDERLSLVGLLIDAVDGRMGDVMMQTEILVSLREDLRAVKAASSADGDCDVAAELHRICAERRSRLEMSVATGVLPKVKRFQAACAIERLEGYALLAQQAAEGGSGRMAAVEADYLSEVSELKNRAGSVEVDLRNAFSFLEEAFGDAQEMLIFVTELTSRASTARYIAQYGSPSYFDHNQDMLLSERQRDLRRRVEELDL